MTQRDIVFDAVAGGKRTVREIMQTAGLGHTGSVRRLLKSLKEDGLVIKEPGTNNWLVSPAVAADASGGAAPVVEDVLDEVVETEGTDTFEEAVAPVNAEGEPEIGNDGEGL